MSAKIWFSTFLLIASLISCGKKDNRAIEVEKPCESPDVFANKLKRLFMIEQVLVGGLKSKGNLCAYTVLIGEKATPIVVYYTQGVIIIGAGYEESGNTFKPFVANIPLPNGGQEKDNKD